MSQTFQTDVDALSAWIRLPAAPRQARWIVREKGTHSGGIGPTDFELIAALEYDPATVNALQGQMEAQTNPVDLYVAQDFLQQWLPDDLQALFASDQLYPGLLRLTTQRYQPTLFTTGSLQNGYVVIAGNHILVYLHTT